LAGRFFVTALEGLDLRRSILELECVGSDESPRDPARIKVRLEIVKRPYRSPCLARPRKSEAQAT
jgi:hypothetical protein